MIADFSQTDQATVKMVKNPRQKGIANTSPMEKLSPGDMQSLRLDEGSRTEFDARVQRFSRSRASLQVFGGEDVVSMDDARYHQLSAAQAKQASDAISVVHFLAPRIRRMRDGAAKRKWRSFLTKFRKDEKLE